MQGKLCGVSTTQYQRKCFRSASGGRWKLCYDVLMLLLFLGVLFNALSGNLPKTQIAMRSWQERKIQARQKQEVNNERRRKSQQVPGIMPSPALNDVCKHVDTQVLQRLQTADAVVHIVVQGKEPSKGVEGRDELPSGEHEPNQVSALGSLID